MPGHSGVPSCALFNRLYYKIGKKDSFARAEVKSKTEGNVKGDLSSKGISLLLKFPCSPLGFC